MASKRPSGDKTMAATAVEFKSNYGTTESTIIYCVHGKPGQTCCDDDGNLVIGIHGVEGSRTRGFSISKYEMQHCHKPREEGMDKKARRKLIIASILCVVFMILEVIGGVLSNSLAIATDAAHLLTDFASFMISLFAIWIAGRPSTKKMSFGWYRAEVLGALVSVLMIWVVTAILVFLAVERVIYRDFHLEPTYMLVTSFLGVLVNVIMGCTLHQHGHTHGASHGHTHGGTATPTGVASDQTGPNINVRAAFIHVLGDFIQSIGVFVAAILIYFKPEWRIADPICTFIFSVLVLVTTFAIIKDALLVLMEGTPKYLDYTEVMQLFLQIEGVVRVHNLRIWALSINKVALSAHLAIDSNVNPEAILATATTSVHAKYNFFESTLQIEIYRPEMDDCGQCINP